MSWIFSRVSSGAAMLLLCALLFAGCEAKCPPTAQLEEHEMSGLRSKVCVNSFKALDGPATTWATNGEKIFEGNFEVEKRLFKTGLPSGTLNWWYESGTQRAKISFASGSLGQPDGKARFWNHDGKSLGEGSYRQGKADGHWTAWHAGGKKAFEGDFNDGLREGVWRYWYADEKPGAQAEYRAGEPVGEWTAWRRGGAQALKMHFEGGKLHDIVGDGPATDYSKTAVTAGLAIPFPHSVQEAYSSMDFSKSPDDKGSVIAPGSMDEIILSVEFDRMFKLFGALFSDLRLYAGQLSPFGSIESSAQLAQAGWIKFDVVR